MPLVRFGAWAVCLMLLNSNPCAAADPDLTLEMLPCPPESCRPANGSEPFGWYVHSVAGISVALPPYLAPRPPKMGGLLEAVERHPGHPEDILVMVQSVESPPPVTLDQHFIRTSQDLRRTLDQCEPRAFGRVRVAGRDAFLVEYSHRIEATPQVMVIAGVLAKPRFVLVSCSASEEAFDTRSDEFDLIIHSLRLPPPAGTAPRSDAK